MFNNAFLIQGEQTLLFDTLPSYSKEDIVNELTSVLSNDELDGSV